jgi:hypothetical protein
VPINRVVRVVRFAQSRVNPPLVRHLFFPGFVGLFLGAFWKVQSRPSSADTSAQVFAIAAHPRGFHEEESRIMGRGSMARWERRHHHACDECFHSFHRAAVGPLSFSFLLPLSSRLSYGIVRHVHAHSHTPTRIHVYYTRDTRITRIGGSAWLPGALCSLWAAAATTWWTCRCCHLSLVGFFVPQGGWRSGVLGGAMRYVTATARYQSNTSPSRYAVLRLVRANATSPPPHHESIPGACVSHGRGVDRWTGGGVLARASVRAPIPWPPEHACSKVASPPSVLGIHRA